MRTLVLSSIFATGLWAQLATPNASGVTAGHIHLMVPDPAAHKKIWVENFGAQPLSTGAIEMLKMPGIFILLSKAEPNGGTEGSSLDHFAFGVKDYAGTKAKLTSAGVQIVRESTGAQKEVVAMFPDRVKVEFYEDTSLATPIYHHHFHFFTADPDGLRAWYGKVFGAQTSQRGNATVTQLPGAALSFRKLDQPAAPTRGRSVDHIGFDVKDVDGFCKNLETMSITCERPGTNARIAFIADPAGTRIELTSGLVSR